MNKKKKRYIQIGALLLFLCCIVFLIYTLILQPYFSRQVNNKYRNIYYSSFEEESGVEATSIESETKYVAALDDRFDNNAKDSNGILCKFRKLLSYNSDVKGWIKIKGTDIDYPVMQAGNGGNFYLRRDFDGKKNQNGSLYIDGNCNVENPSKNIVIHGHNMESTKMMFYELPKYKDIEFYRKHPIITFDSIYDNAKWKIISFMRVSGTTSQNGGFNYLTGDFENDEEFLDFLYEIESRSLYYCPVDVNENDHLLMLSTCSYEVYNYRTVIVARKLRKGESSKLETDKAYIRDDVLFPGSYYSYYGGEKPIHTDFADALSYGELNWYDGKVTAQSSIGKVIKVDKLSYEITSSKTAKFAGCSKSTKELVIPSSIKYNGRKLKVTEIDKSAFKKLTKLEKVKIGNNVDSIPSHTFRECTKLKNVIIGKKVETISKKAFYKLSNLKYVKIKSTDLKSIEDNAFTKTSDKIKFKVPESKYSKYKKLIKNSEVAKTAKFVKYKE